MNTTFRAIWKPAAMMAGLIGVFLFLRASGLDPRQAMDGAGRRGPAAFVAIGAAACAVGLPRQIVAMAGGFAFGLWPGVALAMAAQIAGCALDFGWARLLARRAASRILARRAHGRLARLDRFLSQRAFMATLTLRLLPLGNNLVLNLAAGVSGVAAAPFLLASLIGYLPQTIVFALAGAGAGLSDGTRLGLSVGLLIVSVALGLLLLRRSRAAASV